MQLRLREIAEEWERALAEGAPAPEAITMAHLEALGSVVGIEMFGDNLLVVTFAERTTTAGGIVLPDKSHEEARFQGKSGLVVAMGPQCFADDARVTWGGQRCEVGDWVLLRYGDAFELAKVSDCGKWAVSCRVLKDRDVKARLSDPRLVW